MIDIVYYYVVIVVMFIVVGYMYWINWGIGYFIKEIYEGQKGDFLLFFVINGYDGFYDFMINFWYVQLVVNFVIGGLVSIIVVQYMYVMFLYLY